MCPSYTETHSRHLKQDWCSEGSPPALKCFYKAFASVKKKEVSSHPVWSFWTQENSFHLFLNSMDSYVHFSWTELQTSPQNVNYRICTTHGPFLYLESRF